MSFKVMSLPEALAFDRTLPFTVVVQLDTGDDASVLASCKAWCADEFGAPLWDARTYEERTKTVNVYTDALWSYQVEDDTLDFMFKNETDAMLFKLRWVG